MLICHLFASGNTAGCYAQSKPLDGFETTLTSRFKDSLFDLIGLLKHSQIYTVRCVKSNTEKGISTFYFPFVDEQLKRVNIVEYSLMCRDGFPIYFSVHEFMSKFGSLIRLNFKQKQISGAGTITPVTSENSTEDWVSTEYLGSGSLAGNLVVTAPSEAVVIDVITVLLQRFPHHKLTTGPATEGYVIRNMQDVHGCKTVLCVCAKFIFAEHLRFVKAQVFKSAEKLQACARGFLARRTSPLTQNKLAVRNSSPTVRTTASRLLDDWKTKSSSDLTPVYQLSRVKAASNIAEVGDYKKFNSCEWWNLNERIKGVHCDEQGLLYPWFHGLITRNEAEDVLLRASNGSYLIRLSDKHSSYVLSSNWYGRINHCRIILVSNGYYMLEGFPVSFSTFKSLILYYTEHQVDNKETSSTLGAAAPCRSDLKLMVVFPQGYDEVIVKSDRRSFSLKAVKDKKTVESMKNGPKIRRETIQFQEDHLFRQNEDLSVLKICLPDDALKVKWLHGSITRLEAEALLKDLKKSYGDEMEGLFIVREKLLSHTKCVFILSIASKNIGMGSTYEHHILNRRLEISLNESKESQVLLPWEFDDVPQPGHVGSLFDLICFLHNDDQIILKTELCNYWDSSRKLFVKPFLPGTNVNDWTAENVGAWLTKIGIAKDTQSIFIRRGVTGAALLSMTYEVIETIVNTEHAAKVLWRNLDELKLKGCCEPQVLSLVL